MKNQMKRCMDCKTWNDQWGDTYCSKGEDQKACKKWEPNMTKKIYQSLMKDYSTNEKAKKIFKKIYKYMGEEK